MIAVAAAVIVREGRILLCQRPETKDFAFTWECPGGKVDGSETYYEALRREMREELNIELGTIRERPLWAGEFNGIVVRSERQHVQLSFFAVQFIIGMPVPQEQQGIGWFYPREMSILNLAPANIRALDHIIAYINESQT